MIVMNYTKHVEILGSIVRMYACKRATETEKLRSEGDKQFEWPYYPLAGILLLIPGNPKYSVYTLLYYCA